MVDPLLIKGKEINNIAKNDYKFMEKSLRIFGQIVIRSLSSRQKL